MIMNKKVAKGVKYLAIVFTSIVLLNITIILIVPRIEFSSIDFNQFWRIFIWGIWIIGIILFGLLFTSYSKIGKVIFVAAGIPTGILALFFMKYTIEKIDYEPKYDRYIVFKNVFKPNQYVVVQDYINWKHNRPAIDTTLIDDYYVMRMTTILDSMNVKGTWLKLDEKGNVLDTIKIK
ncbi:MAG: hypothetical protein LCH54_11695 [Bacteroidetes bacterium]|nr:hypothetical protein [Bacteroidota bacterium]